VPVVTDALREVEQFVFREARLQDEHEYDAWEALWTDDGVYWVPCGADDVDPNRSMSIIYDNRARIATRIKQLHTGKRHAQLPRSRLRRLVSNVELLEETADGFHATANFVIFESRAARSQIWAGRSEYHLRRTDEGLKMASKKVLLVDADRPLHTLAFLV
jgi:3-phenylpropionate/cinnamic acid dioxygenase small subunit